MNELTKNATKHPYIIGFASLLIGAACMTSPHLKGTTTTGPPASAAQDLSDSFKNAIARVSPAVVHIFSEVRGGGFFGSPSEGQGSGVITRDDGIIVTNNHVVMGASRLRVLLGDGRDFFAQVLGTDPASDLAVIKIDAKDLPVAELGDSDSVEVGDWVLAMGNPFGLSNTVTAGIVSAKGRAGVGVARFEDFIQTDCAINPGNSGGPLVNLEGFVVGINSAIASRTGGYQGIGFSIPARMVKNIAEGLIDLGRVQRGWLGVESQTISPALAASIGAEAHKGVMVARVIGDTPAQRAGLKTGDIILSVDGRLVATQNELVNAVTQNKPGDLVTMSVMRSGEPRDFLVTLGERTEEVARLEQQIPERHDLRRAIKRGLTVTELAPDAARRLNVAKSGVLVVHVDPRSSAYESGIRSGAIILKAGRVQIESLDNFIEAMDDVDEDTSILLFVSEPTGRRFVAID